MSIVTTIPQLLGIPKVDLLSGLVAYYKMEADSTDDHGSHDGTDVGTITYGAGSGKISNGLSITGTTSMVTLADLTGLTGVTQFSVAAWIYSTATGQRYIACIDNVDYPNNYAGWSLIQLNSGALELVVGKNLNSGFSDGVDYRQAITSTTISLSTWYHVVGTYDGNVIRIYLNGVLEASQPWVAGLGWAGTNYGRIGAERAVVLGVTYDPYNAFGQNPWQGYIDELGIWNRAINSREVVRLFRGALGTQYPF